MDLDRLLGCLFGGAIGDCLGGAHEGKPSPRVVDWGAPWQLSDDTQLTLATCEAIQEPRRVDPEVVAETFLRWFRARRLTGLGASTLKALRDLDIGVHWALAGRKGEMAAGNGAAMRAAPLGFVLDPKAPGDRVVIRDVCRITHHNDEAYAGALAVVFAVRHAITNRPAAIDDLVGSVVRQLPDCVVRDRLFELSGGAFHSISEVAAKLGSSGYVADSVPLALFAAGQLEHIGFRTVLEELVAVGGDTDTNAAIAGQVIGSAIGFSGLDDASVERVPERDMIVTAGRALCERVGIPTDQ